MHFKIFSFDRNQHLPARLTNFSHFYKGINYAQNKIKFKVFLFIFNIVYEVSEQTNF